MSTTRAISKWSDPSRFSAACLVVDGGLGLAGTGAGAVAGRQRIVVRATEFVPPVTAHLDALFAQLSRTGALTFLLSLLVCHSDETFRVAQLDERRSPPRPMTQGGAAMGTAPWPGASPGKGGHRPQTSPMEGLEGPLNPMAGSAAQLQAQRVL